MDGVWVLEFWTDWSTNDIIINCNITFSEDAIYRSL